MINLCNMWPWLDLYKSEQILENNCRIDYNFTLYGSIHTSLTTSQNYKTIMGIIFNDEDMFSAEELALGIGSEDPTDYVYTEGVDDDNNIYYVVTPKELWKQEHRWDDSGWYPEFLEELALDQLSDSVYEFIGESLTPTVGIELEELGVTKDPILITNFE